MEFTIKGGNAGAKIYIDNKRENEGILLFDVHMELSEEAVP